MTSVRLCRGEHEDHTRIFHARYTTSRGRTLEGGTATSECVTRTTPPGRQLTGFHDRAGDELDSLGLIYTRGNPTDREQDVDAPAHQPIPHRIRIRP